jgi:hypothetical protein
MYITEKFFRWQTLANYGKQVNLSNPNIASVLNYLYNIHGKVAGIKRAVASWT